MFQLKASHSLLISIIALSVSSCSGSGKKIDATNADTLSATIEAIGESMSEIDRQAFGQDIILIYEHASDGIDEVTQNILYSNDYPVLSQATQREGIFTDVFQEIALKAGDALDKKTPATLAQDANSIRSDFFTTYANNLEAQTNQFQDRLDAITPTLEKHKAEIATAQTNQNELTRKVTSAISNITISSFAVNKSVSAITEGIADITNYSDVPIEKVFYRLEFELADVKDHFFTARTSVTLENPLPPGKTIEAQSINFNSLANINIRAKKGTKQISILQAVGTHPTANPISMLEYYSTKRKGGRKSDRRELTLSRENSNLLRDSERIIERCEKSIQALETAITQNKEFLKVVKSRINSPSPFDGTPTRISGRPDNDC